MIWPNFSVTPFRRPSRLFSARVSRKFLRVAPLAPACLTSSATIADLSAGVRVGADRILPSLASLSRMPPSLASSLAVASRVEVLEAAVY
jgi:hypothetical protein